MSGLHTGKPDRLPLEVAEQIDRVCDRFEAAWRAGQHPRLEPFLEGAGAIDRAALFTELLAAELALRAEAGEQPEPREYLDRFPGEQGLIDALFAEATTAGGEPEVLSPEAIAQFTGADTEEIPLVALLALQMGYVERDGLEAALVARGPDRARPLGPILLARGLIDADTLELLEKLVRQLAAGVGGPAAPAQPGRAEPSPSAPLAARSTVEDSERADGLAVSAADVALETTLPDPTPARFQARAMPRVPGYELLGELGRGGMGVVYRARQIRLNRPCALKMILAGDHASAESMVRFLAEARTVAQLQHPNIVQIYAIGDHDGRPFLELEFVEGGTLAERIDGTPWPAHSAAAFVDTLARAIQEAHKRGIVHRDLKPANVLLTPDGMPKVTDFGLAKALSAEMAITRTESIVGSPSYMAPEQAEGKSRRVGIEADVYALGAILYELVTGRPPFKAATILDTLEQVKHSEPVPPSRLQPRLSRDLETICLKCLRKEPEKRYATAQELAEDLTRFLDHRPILARPVSRVVHLARWCRRNRAVAALTVLATLATLAALVVSVGFGLYQSRTASVLRVALADAQAQRRNADLRLADLTFQRGQAVCERGDVDRGILWLARALEIAHRAGASEVERVSRAGLAGWSARLHPLRQQFEHQATVLAIAFSPDGKEVMTGSADETARIWNASTGAPVAPPLEHSGPVESVAFSASGKVLLTRVRSGPAQLWDRATHRPLGEPLDHPGAVTAALFSPDGALLATAGRDGRVRLWEAETAKPVGAPLEHSGAVNVIAFLPNGKRLITGCEDGTVHAWDVAARKRAGAPLELGSPVRCLAINPAGNLALTGTEKGIAQIWDLATGRALSGPMRSDAALAAVAFSPDGTLALTASRNWKARLWEVPSGKPFGEMLKHQAPITAASFGPQGTLVLTASRDGTARLWEVDGTRPFGAPLQHRGIVLAAQFSPDGTRVLTAGDQRAAQLWQVQRPSGSSHPFASKEWIYALDFSPDGRLLAVGDEVGEVRVSQWADGQAAGPSLHHTDLVRAVAFTHDGKRIVSGSEDHTVRICDFTSGQETGKPLVHSGRVYSLAVSPDDQFLLSGTQDGQVSLWDWQKGARVRSARVHQGPILTVAFSPDGKRFLTGSADYSARLWETATGEPIGAILHHEGQVFTSAFSPDGRIVATGSGDKSVRFWDAESAEPLGPPIADEEPIRFVAFGPGGKTLFVGCWSDRSRLWDFATRMPIGPAFQHGGMVLAVRFEEKSAQLITASEDKTVRVNTLPAPMAGTVEHIELWAEVATAMVLTSNDVSRLLNIADWAARKEQLEPK